MLDPDALLDTLVAMLQDIEVLDNLVPAQSIRAYHHDYPTAANAVQAVNQLKPPSIMVAHTETRIGRRLNGIEHHFCAYLRPQGRVGPVFLALRDGVVATQETKFKFSVVDSECHPPDILGVVARTIWVSEQSSIDYHEIPIVLTERSVDT